MPYRCICQSRRAGFTLIEFVVVMAMVAGLMTLSFVVYLPAQTTNHLTIAAESIASSLRFASQNARSMQWNSAWGVFVSATSVTMFAGPSFSQRMVGLDETTELQAVRAVSGVSEIVFRKYDGYPATAVTTTLEGTDGTTRSISVNQRARVDY